MGHSLVAAVHNHSQTFAIVSCLTLSLSWQSYLARPVVYGQVELDPCKGKPRGCGAGIQGDGDLTAGLGSGHGLLAPLDLLVSFSKLHAVEKATMRWGQ